jgi:hypothetical protein
VTSINEDERRDQFDGTKDAGTALEDIKMNVKIKISALWASVMFCYVYADYFGLYVPGALQKMLEGKMGPLGPTTQLVLLGTSLMMAIPSVMIFLSVALNANPNRWLNIVFGVIYTAIIMITMWDWAFYIFFGIVEVVLTGLIVWYAWNWPKNKAA